MPNDYKKLTINQNRPRSFQSLGELRIMNTEPVSRTETTAPGMVAARMAFGGFSLPNIQPEQPSNTRFMDRERNQ